MGGNGFDDSGGGCMVDEMPRSCSETMFMRNMGIAEDCPFNYCGAKVVPVRNGDGEIIGQGLSPLTRDPNSGMLGYADIIKEDEEEEESSGLHHAPAQN